jgi:hypothetical protein
MSGRPHRDDLVEVGYATKNAIRKRQGKRSISPNGLNFVVERWEVDEYCDATDGARAKILLNSTYSKMSEVSRRAASSAKDGFMNRLVSMIDTPDVSLDVGKVSPPPSPPTEYAGTRLNLKVLFSVPDRSETRPPKVELKFRPRETPDERASLPMAPKIRTRSAETPTLVMGSGYQDAPPSNPGDDVQIRQLYERFITWSKLGIPNMALQNMMKTEDPTGTRLDPRAVFFFKDDIFTQGNATVRDLKAKLDGASLSAATESTHNAMYVNVKNVSNADNAVKSAWLGGAEVSEDMIHIVNSALELNGDKASKPVVAKPTTSNKVASVLNGNTLQNVEKTMSRLKSVGWGVETLVASLLSKNESVMKDVPIAVVLAMLNIHLTKEDVKNLDLLVQGVQINSADAFIKRLKTECPNFETQAAAIHFIHDFPTTRRDIERKLVLMRSTTQFMNSNEVFKATMNETLKLINTINRLDRVGKTVPAKPLDGIVFTSLDSFTTRNAPKSGPRLLKGLIALMQATYPKTPEVDRLMNSVFVNYTVISTIQDIREKIKEIENKCNEFTDVLDAAFVSVCRETARSFAEWLGLNLEEFRRMMQTYKQPPNDDPSVVFKALYDFFEAYRKTRAPSESPVIHISDKAYV